jgi:hypothetical protein
MGRGEVVGSAAFWKQKRTLMAEEIARFDHDKTKLRTYAAETLGIDLSRRVPVVEDQRTILYTLRARLDELARLPPSELARHLLAWRWGVNWKDGKLAAENTDAAVRVLPVDETTGWVMPPTAKGRGRIEVIREDGTVIVADLLDFVGLNDVPGEG